MNLLFLRHTTATRLVVGVKPAKVQELLGSWELQTVSNIIAPSVSARGQWVPPEGDLRFWRGWMGRFQKLEAKAAAAARLSPAERAPPPDPKLLGRCEIVPERVEAMMS
jgi:hypothetical protein